MSNEDLKKEYEEKFVIEYVYGGINRKTLKELEPEKLWQWIEQKIKEANSFKEKYDYAMKALKDYADKTLEQSKDKSRDASYRMYRENKAHHLRTAYNTIEKNIEMCDRINELKAPGDTFSENS